MAFQETSIKVLEQKLHAMNTFDKIYPYLSSWVHTTGWIEIGQDEYSTSWIRILNEGGMVYEDEGSKTLERALQKAEYYLKTGFEEDFGFKLEVE